MSKTGRGVANVRNTPDAKTLKKCSMCYGLVDQMTVLTIFKAISRLYLI